VSGRSSFWCFLFCKQLSFIEAAHDVNSCGGGVGLATQTVVRKTRGQAAFYVPQDFELRFEFRMLRDGLVFGQLFERDGTGRSDGMCEDSFDLFHAAGQAQAGRLIPCVLAVVDSSLVEVVASSLGDLPNEFTDGPAIALPLGVKSVPVTEMMGETTSKFRLPEPAEIIFSREFRAQSTAFAFDVCGRSKRRAALRHLDSTDFSGELVNVLKKVLMDAL
jgi:hypothetical protein